MWWCCSPSMMPSRPLMLAATRVTCSTAGGCCPARTSRHCETRPVRVVCVAGARPNYMKVKPVMDALEERGAQVILVHTGQHYDPAMSDVFFAELDIRRPDHFLGAGSGTHAVQTCRVMTAFEPLAAELAPDLVVVVGDVMVDTLLANAGRAAARGTLAGLGLRPGQYGLVTLHRPANVDDPAVLGALLPALAEISRRCPLVLPAHPRAAGQLRRAEIPGVVRVIPPAGYLDFIALETSARLVLTDSGGVQEETTVLGVPCLTLRDSTEPPITLTEGTNRLVGRDPDRIVRAAREVLAAPPPRLRTPTLWDGHAGRRIAAALVAGHDARGRRGASLPDT